MFSRERRRDVHNRIDEDAESLYELFESGHEGRWDIVFQILGPYYRPQNAHLLNCIPETKFWGLAHYAVWFRDERALKYLLRYRAFDSEIRVTGKNVRDATPLALANAWGYTKLARVIKHHRHPFGDNVEPPDTFQQNFESIESGGILAITLAAYKNTFHPNRIDPHRCIADILGDIFRDLNAFGDRWKNVRDNVRETLYVVMPASSRNVKGSRRSDFYRSIINVYTEESTFLYTLVNTALRKQKGTNYQPSASDLAIGPYAVMFQMLLLHWTALRKENRTTYRTVILSKSDANKYRVGVTFSWLSFVSSSVDMENAIPFPTCQREADENEKIVFTINNSRACVWQPRNIESFAQYQEQERTYPAGSRFEVTRRFYRHGDMHVWLRLAPNDATVDGIRRSRTQVPRFNAGRQYTFHHGNEQPLPDLFRQMTAYNN